MPATAAGRRRSMTCKGASLGSSAAQGDVSLSQRTPRYHREATEPALLLRMLHKCPPTRGRCARLAAVCWGSAEQPALARAGLRIRRCTKQAVATRMTAQ